MMDINSFLNRMNWSQKDLAQRLELGTSTIGMWCVGKSTPAYNVIIKLIELGIKPVELFGKEISEKLIGDQMEELKIDKNNLDETIRNSLLRLLSRTK